MQIFGKMLKPYYIAAGVFGSCSVNERKYVMILISVAAIPELLLVGMNATMTNAHPYNVIE